MKLLIQVEGPGVDNFAVREPDAPAEIKAFVASLVKSRTRGPEPVVGVTVVQEDQVLVNYNDLVKIKGELVKLRHNFDERRQPQHDDQ